MINPKLTQAEYDEFRAKIEAADSAFKRLAPKVWEYGGVIPECVTQDPAWSQVNNDIRSAVEQFRILTELPETIVAYIGSRRDNGMGVAREMGAGYPVTTWIGLQIGNATRGATWRVNSFIGTHMSQFYARIGGREYTGRGFGEGMSIVLRETAESKRKNPRQKES